MNPKYHSGDRVVMVEHAGWRAPLTGRVQGNPRPRPGEQGPGHLEYFIRFDQFQTARQFLGTTVREEYLRPLTRRETR